MTTSPKDITVQTTTPADLPALADAVAATGLFPPDLLPTLFDGGGGGGDGATHWLTACVGDTPIGFAFAAQEELAEGTWNMMAIAVHPDMQGTGVGTALVAALESRLRDDAARLLIVDTSGAAGFAATRAFYAARGYREEACVRDFWAPGDDKVIFTKGLAGRCG
ncbi:MAG: GNAT family N-acetyltransferase [Pseudomonadota bacterium]